MSTKTIDLFVVARVDVKRILVVLLGVDCSCLMTTALPVGC